MKLPRDLGGNDLARALRRLGYEVSRQTGSHLRLTIRLPSEHHVTIPYMTSCASAPLPRSWTTSPLILEYREMN